MHEIVKKILFDELQLKKGNNTKKNRTNLSRDLSLLKVLIDNKDFNQAYLDLSKNKNIYDLYVAGNLFPKTISDVSTYPEIGYTKSIKVELRWQLKVIETYSEQLNSFIMKKEEYDLLLLEGEFERALEILNDVAFEYGYSYWLLENTILIFNKLGLNEKTSNIISRANSDFMSNVLSFFDMKSKDDMQARDYEYIIRREIAKFKNVYPDLLEVIDWYTYFIAPFIFKMSEESILHLLDCIKTFSLIDRYLTVIDIIEYYMSEYPENELPKWLIDDMPYLEDINDSTVITFRYLSSDIKTKISDFSINDVLHSYKNIFLSGKLDECFYAVKSDIEKSSTNISLYIFYIELCQLRGCEVESLGVSDIKIKIISNLKRILSVSDNYDDSLDEIYQICFWNFHAKWARDIFNQITRNVQPINSEDERTAIKYSNLQYLTIDTIIENLSKEDALEVLNSKNKDLYLSYRTAILKGDINTAANICKVKNLSELILLQHSTSFEDYASYLNANNPEIYKITCCKYLWENMESKEDFEQGIDYFIHMFIKNEQYVIMAPIEKFIKYASDCPSVDRQNIRISILYYIYSTYFEPSAKDDLSISCEDFFDMNDISKPSMMKNGCDNYSIEQLVYFLRYICIPQIMGPVLLTVRTSKELEEERISICQNLKELDPENDEIYDQEIKDITHKLFLNDGVSTIETHKIQVNTDGIKTRISKDLKTLFNKYMYSRNIKLDVFLDKIKNLEGGEAVSLISLDSNQIFNEIVTTIRNEFVLGDDYGLDTYLSLNIRHGTLTGQLRAPLANKGLLAEKVFEKDDYVISNRWLYKIRDYNSRERAKKAIIEFTRDTDAIIDYLKKELIQISTEEKPTNGVFDYSLESSQIKYLQSYLTERGEFDDFIDSVFEFLWKYTELNLDNMRTVIREEIKQKYYEAFDNLNNTYKGFNIDFPEATQWIKEAQNDMDAELEKICEWFKRSSDGQYPDFDLDSAFQVGLQTVKNIHPTMKFKVNYVEKNIQEKIDGSAWKYFVSIFNILFDNISKYASEEDGVKNVDCTLKSDKDGIYIKMENGMDCEGDLANKFDKISSAMNLISNASYLARAKQEGGSGIPKIYKMLAVDLNMKPHVNCDIIEDKRLFRVEIGGGYQ